MPVLSSLSGHEVNDIAQAAVEPRRWPRAAAEDAFIVFRSSEGYAFASRRITPVNDSPGPRMHRRYYRDCSLHDAAVEHVEAANSVVVPFRLQSCVMVPSLPLLHGQARLGAVERLDLALLVD